MRPTHADPSFPRPSRRAAVTLTALTLVGALAWPARARAQSVDAVLPLVEQQLRILFLGRQQGYRAGGLTAIAPYDRGDGRLGQPGGEVGGATTSAGGVS